MALTKEELQKVVAVGLYTDGNVYYRKWDNKYNIRFYSSDQLLNTFFQNLVFDAFGETRSGFSKYKGKNLWTTSYQRGTKNQMVQKLFSFSNTYSTTKGKEPTLSFLLDEREEVKITSLRFAMSCDGSISIKTKKKTGAKSFALRLACAHPKLNGEFQRLFADIGIDMRIDKDKRTWSGIHGLRTGKHSNILKFAELGGFLPENVKVSNGAFIGFEKNQVLQNVVKLIKERESRQNVPLKNMIEEPIF